VVWEDQSKKGEVKVEKNLSRQTRTGSLRPQKVTLCDRCGSRMVEKNCKVTCPNCGNRFDCSDLNIYFD
jgi:rubrerythrin